MDRLPPEGPSLDRRKFLQGAASAAALGITIPYIVNSPAAQASSTGTTPSPSCGLGGVMLGDSPSRVRATLGGPISIGEGQSGSEWRYNGTTVRFMSSSSGDTVRQVVVDSGKAATSSGLALGGTEQQLKAVYGSALQQEPSVSGTAYSAQCQSGQGYDFFLSDGAMTTIILTQDECAPCLAMAEQAFAGAGDPTIVAEKIAVAERFGVASS